MKLIWTLQENGASRATGALPLAAKARQSEIVTVPATLPAGAEGGVWTLAVRCVDENGARSTNARCASRSPARRICWPNCAAAWRRAE